VLGKMRFLERGKKSEKEGGGGGEGNGPVNKGLCALGLQVLETFINFASS